MNLKNFLKTQSNNEELYKNIDIIHQYHAYYTYSVEINLLNEVICKFNTLYYNCIFYKVNTKNIFNVYELNQYWLKVNQFYFIIHYINYKRRAFSIILLNNKVKQLENIYFLTHFLEFIPFYPIDNKDNNSFINSIYMYIYTNYNHTLTKKQCYWLYDHWLIYFRIFNQLIDERQYKELDNI